MRWHIYRGSFAAISRCVADYEPKRAWVSDAGYALYVDADDAWTALIVDERIAWGPFLTWDEAVDACEQRHARAKEAA